MQSDAALAEDIDVPDSKPAINPYIAIFILTIATFMEVMDISIVNVSLPKIAGELSVTPVESAWIIGSYLVANAMILPINGWLAIYFGRKKYFLGCLALFILSSFLCGIASDLTSLITFRIMQGLSGSGLATSEQAMIADMVPPEKLGRAFSIYALGITAAPVIAPTLGGWITENLNWRWVFFINIPIGILSIFLVYFFIEESPKAKAARLENKKKQGSIDWLGILFFIVAVGSLELALEEGPRAGWFESGFIIALFFISISSLILGITWVWNKVNPVVDVHLFKDRNFAISCILLFTVRFMMVGSTFVIPLMAQTLLSYDAFTAGLVLLPGALVLMLMMPVIGYLTDKTDIRRVILTGLILSVAALGYISTFSLDVSFNELATGRFYQSFALSFLAATMMTVGFYYVPSEKNDNASSLVSLCSNVGASIGVAVSSAYLAYQTQSYIKNSGYYTSDLNPNYTTRLEELASHLKAQGMNALEATEGARRIIWQTVQREASMNSFLDVLNLFMILLIVLIPFVFFLKPRKR